jgi:hypothetical protein
MTPYIKAYVELLCSRLSHKRNLILPIPSLPPFTPTKATSFLYNVLKWSSLPYPYSLVLNLSPPQNILLTFHSTYTYYYTLL